MRQGRYQLLQGDVRQVLSTLSDKSVQVCFTSPPYWSLRDYGTATWEGGDPNCKHSPARRETQSSTLSGGHGNNGHQHEGFRGSVCKKCGAVKTDFQLGLETLHDCNGWVTGQPCGECYVCHMVEVFREVKRVLRDDGVLWLNLGDSYAGSGGPGSQYDNKDSKRPRLKGEFEKFENPNRKTGPSCGAGSLKPKDMVGIPWRVAFALQANGWYLRMDNIWSKNNPMPESVTDRPTKSHEYVFLFSKSRKYFYDRDAVSVPCSESTHARVSQDVEKQIRSFRANGVGKTNSPMNAVIKTPKQREPGSGIKNNDSFNNALSVRVATRNLRSVWAVNTQAYKDAHFATFPEALPEIGIKAGSSEAGECPACGKAFVRVVNDNSIKAHTGKTSKKFKPGESGNRLSLLRQAARENGEEYHSNRETLGWKPQCNCGKEPIPQVVLDPFSGSGTTGAVAVRLGRDYIGIDLNPEYIQLAEKRIGKEILPMLAMIE